MKRKHVIAVLVITSIVIAVLGILIAVGVPAWRAAVRGANEAAAIKSLTTISEQQQMYYNSHQRSFGTFDEMLKGNLLDTRFQGTEPVVDGFVYTMRVTPKSTNQPSAFAVNADPELSEGFSATGRNHFYIDSNNDKIHVNSKQPATASDPTIGQP